MPEPDPECACQAGAAGAVFPKIFFNDWFPPTFGFSWDEPEEGNSGNKDLSNLGALLGFDEEFDPGTLKGSIVREEAVAFALADQGVVRVV